MKNNLCGRFISYSAFDFVEICFPYVCIVPTCDFLLGVLYINKYVINHKKWNIFKRIAQKKYYSLFVFFKSLLLFLVLLLLGRFLTMFFTCLGYQCWLVLLELLELHTVHPMVLIRLNNQDRLLQRLLQGWYIHSFDIWFHIILPHFTSL